MIISAFFNNLWDFILKYSKEFISTFIVIIICLLALVIGYLILKKYISNNKRKYVLKLANSIFSFYKFIVIFIGLIIVCSTWGIKLTAVLIGVAIILIGIIISAKNSIADIINGLSITFGNYFDIDEFVDINGFKGYVKEVNLKTTKIVNINNEIKTISNAEIRNVINYSRNPYIHIIELLFDFTVNDINNVITLLEDSMSCIGENYDEIIEGPNVIGLSDVNNQGYVIKIVFKAKYDWNNLIISKIKLQTKNVLDKNNINFKFISKEK